MEVLNVLNLCWGNSYQCIHYFGCKIAVSSAIFHLFCTLIHDQLVKSKKHSIYRTDFFFNSVSSKHV